MENFFKNPEPSSDITYQILLGRSLAAADSTNFQAGIFKQSLSPADFRRLYQHYSKFTWDKKNHSLYYYYQQADLIWVCDRQVRSRVYRRWVLDQLVIKSKFLAPLKLSSIILESEFDLQLLKLRQLPSQVDSVPPKTVQAKTKIHKFQFQNAEVKIFFEIVVEPDDQTDHLNLIKDLPTTALYQIRFELPLETAKNPKVMNKYI